MFSEEQINEINSKSQSGDSYPKRVKEMKNIGIKKYSFEVEDGANIYYGNNDFMIETKPKYEKLIISGVPSKEKFLKALSIHQRGETDFPTFCRQTAESGIKRWVSDLDKMVVNYLDKNNNLIAAEPIPKI